MVLTSSAAAAPPAHAWRSPLAFCSCSANAAPNACCAARDNNAVPTAAATRVGRNVRDLILLPLLSVVVELLRMVTTTRLLALRRGCETIHARRAAAYSAGSGTGRRSSPTAT